jgi:hypothetical protein
MTNTYGIRFVLNHTGTCSSTTAGIYQFEYDVSSESGVPAAGDAFASATKR